MYSFKIIPELNLIVLRLSEVVFWEDIEEYYGKLIKDPNYHRELMGVCDLRGADMRFTPEQSKILAQMSREQQLTTGKWAFIADTPSGTALSVVFGREIEDFHDSQFFCTVESASDYLDIDLTTYLD